MTSTQEKPQKATQRKDGKNVFLTFLELYRSDTPKFVREVLGAKPYPEQDAIMRDYDARERRISVRSGHGVGKTTVLAWIIIHHALTRFPQKTVCTAATKDQLFDALASETKAWISKLPPPLKALFDVKAESIDYLPAPDESFISFRVSRADKPEALQGVHSANVLLIADEASGVPDQIFEAAIGSMSGDNATTILAGNPIRSSGLFYDSHHKMRDIYRTHVISCIGHPNVTPDLVEDVRRRYGEKSNAFRVRILGEFPLADDDTVIPFELMEAALKRDVRPLLVRPIWGVDVARFGMDGSALAKRKGNVLLEPVKQRHGRDIMEVTGWIKNEWDSTPAEDRPEDINVDAIGIGAGVADRLRELGLPARAVNVSESPSLREQYRNLRAELWLKAKDWFAARDCNIAGDQKLGAQLTAVKYKFTSGGKIQIEAKDEIKKRITDSSPDVADAFILTFASEAVTAIGGSTQASWRQPIHRHIRGIV